MCTWCLFAPLNLHHLERWSKFAPGSNFAGCIFIKHRLHDQNTPQVLIYTLCVYLHAGANGTYKRGTTISFIWIWLAVDFLRPKLCEISIQIRNLKNWTPVTFNYFMHNPVFEHSDTLLFALLACSIMHINGK